MAITCDSDCYWMPMPELPTEPVHPLYYEGRWSNGSIWVDTLAEEFRLESPMPSLGSYPGLNYAVADARVGTGYNPRYSVWTGQPLDEPFVPSIGEQIATHESMVGEIEAKQLVLLWVGGNDIIFAQGLDDILSAVDDLGEHVRDLVALGAEHVVVPNMIDLSNAPIFSELSDSEREQLGGAVMIFNGLLAFKLTELQEKFGSNVNIYDVDFFTVGEKIFNEPEACGFATVGSPAVFALLDDLLQGSCEFDNCIYDDDYNDPYVFWDTIHPTAAVHDLLGKAAANVIEGKDLMSGVCN